jgi:hypothetical protein
MRCLYFDCFAGASGDMVVGAMIDLGLNLDYLVSELNKLPLTGYEISTSRVNKNGISATRFEVSLLTTDGNVQLADEHNVEAKYPVHQEHTHDDISGHQSCHHTLNAILEILASSSLSPGVKETASRIFRKLGEAEAKVHNQPIDSIHFHEVGETDAVIDIVSAAIGVEWLNPDEIIVSPIHLGTGFVSTSHGRLPVPAPATAEILQNLPVYTTETKGELITPTGAAILATLATGSGPLPVMTIRNIGYGAGKRDRDFPNVLRICAGEKTADIPPLKKTPASRDPYPEQHASPENEFGVHQGSAMILEANLDDMNPQLFGSLMDHLLEAGAMDVIFIPVQMKKNRPGIKLQVMIPPEDEAKYLSIIFSETTTIGVRSYPVKKNMLRRELVMVKTPYGPINVKISRLSGKIVNISPEYEDCLVLADQHGLPVKEIIASANASAQLIRFEVGK